MKTKTETETFESFVESKLVKNARDHIIVKMYGHDALVQDIEQWPHLHKDVCVYDLTKARLLGPYSMLECA
tara:strand:+ start:282 stop:494 length:213 start_codon:yes stop_codon:yes gene_type:complete